MPWGSRPCCSRLGKGLATGHSVVEARIRCVRTTSVTTRTVRDICAGSLTRASTLSGSPPQGAEAERHTEAGEHRNGDRRFTEVAPLPALGDQ